MAGKKDLEQIYSSIDFIFRRSFGESGDYSGALFDGDFDITLERAQERKHAAIATSLGLSKGSKVVDLGCGWGGFLEYARSRGIAGVGLTLSARQAAACRRRGLDVREHDCRDVSPQGVGEFAGAVSLGAFEHFCSIEDWQAGRQDRIYRDFFASVASVLPPGGRLFLQTMVFGPNMIDADAVDLHAPRDSDAYAVGLMRWGNPGSWLPANVEQVVTAAQPHFQLASSSNGRLDYIETLKRWSCNFKRFDLPKYLVYAALLPRLLISGTLRYYLDALRIDPNRVCFERLIMDHYRLVFERADR